MDAPEKWALATDILFDWYPAVAADGTIYMGAGGGLWAVNSDGTLKWTLHLCNDGGGGSPAVGADGTIYVGVESNTPLAASHTATASAR